MLRGEPIKEHPDQDDQHDDGDDDHCWARSRLRLFLDDGHGGIVPFRLSRNNRPRGVDQLSDSFVILYAFSTREAGVTLHGGRRQRLP
jgi:hypothetical protein